MTPAASWHDDPLSQQLDAERQALLEAHGHLVLRVRWRQTVEHPDHAITRITDGLTRTQRRQ